MLLRFWRKLSSHVRLKPFINKASQYQTIFLYSEPKIWSPSVSPVQNLVIIYLMAQTQLCRSLPSVFIHLTQSITKSFSLCTSLLSSKSSLCCLHCKVFVFLSCECHFCLAWNPSLASLTPTPIPAPSQKAVYCWKLNTCLMSVWDLVPRPPRDFSPAFPESHPRVAFLCLLNIVLLIRLDLHQWSIHYRWFKIRINFPA